VSDKRMNTEIPTVIERRQPHPLELASMASVAGALVLVLLGLLLDRPMTELWRWLVIGFMLPWSVFLVATLAPVMVWMLETLSRRDFNADGVVGKPQPETIRLLPVRSQAPRIRLSGEDDEGFEPDDLRALLHHAYLDHTTRSFYGMTLPSGRKITSGEDVAPFLRIIERMGLLVDRGPRRSGRMVGDEREARRRLGL
jgi:hypothetical protein